MIFTVLENIFIQINAYYATMFHRQTNIIFLQAISKAFTFVVINALVTVSVFSTAQEEIKFPPAAKNVFFYIVG